MGLKFRLKGLAETFIDTIQCPKCGFCGSNEDSFTTELTKVTYDGIVVIVECKYCSNVFVPDTQRLGIVSIEALNSAVEADKISTGDHCRSLAMVRLEAEKMNVLKNGELH